ncbi:Cupredoxin, partial [Dunaliella salina]
MDENGTLEPLLHQSITKAGLTSEGQSAAQWIESVPEENAPDWEESNVMHGINGLMYCNWEVSVNHGDKIRMLLAGFGSEEGIHSPRVIGQVLKVMGTPSQSEMIMPAVSRAADIEAVNDGQWPALCDIQDHVYAGMIGTLMVGNARRTSMVSV